MTVEVVEVVIEVIFRHDLTDGGQRAVVLKPQVGQAGGVEDRICMFPRKIGVLLDFNF